MIDYGKKNLLGVAIDAVNYEAAVDKIIVAAKAKRPCAVSALAVHGVMTGVLDDEHRYRLNHIDLVVPDGQPVRWAINWIHKIKLTDRVYGPTLTLKVCEQAAKENLSIYLYGSTQPVVSSFAENLQKLIPELKIAGYEPSLFRQTTSEERVQIARRIQESGADIAIVGLGCPRQEVWAYEYRSLLSMPILAVGAAFDFHAGMLDQAPRQMQDLGLEWLFRLWKEPKRLWRRYVILNPQYVWLVSKQKLQVENFMVENASQPKTELLYG